MRDLLGGGALNNVYFGPYLGSDQPAFENKCSKKMAITVEMTVEMVANLLFGLGDKAEAPLVAEHATGSTDQECT